MGAHLTIQIVEFALDARSIMLRRKGGQNTVIGHLVDGGDRSTHMPIPERNKPRAVFISTGGYRQT
jgi:hypothetical protein